MKDIDIIKYIRKDMTPEEEKEFLEWLEESGENRERYSALKNLWAVSAVGSDIGAILSTNAGETDNEIYMPHLLGKVFSFLKYAAVVVVTIGLSLYLCHESVLPGHKNHTSYYTVAAPLGQATNIILADGSKVTLNSGTVLTYPVDYSGKNRRVNLTGEAFFEVQTDKKSPFTVTASGIDIVATGTSFNVNAYPDDSQASVTLVEGTVNLYSREGKNLVTLNPGENATIDFPSEAIDITQVDTRFFTSWQQGMITFSNRRLEDITRDLERWYCVEIVFGDDACKEIRYSGTILKHKPVDQVLEILQLTSDFKFDIEVIDNKLSKITIKK